MVTISSVQETRRVIVSCNIHLTISYPCRLYHMNIAAMNFMIRDYNIRIWGWRATTLYYLAY